MHSMLRASALTAVFLVLAGCSKDSTTEPPLVFPENEYALVTINGSTLPYLYPNSTHTTMGGYFDFTDDDSWVLTSIHCEELPCQGSAIRTTTVLGTYTVSGTTIAFRETSPGNLRFNGEFTMDAQTLTLNVQHPTLGPSLRVYHKQQ